MPTFSVIVNTYNRALSLRETIEMPANNASLIFSNGGR